MLQPDHTSRHTSISILRWYFFPSCIIWHFCCLSSYSSFCSVQFSRTSCCYSSIAFGFIMVKLDCVLSLSDKFCYWHAKVLFRQSSSSNPFPWTWSHHHHHHHHHLHHLNKVCVWAQHHSWCWRQAAFVWNSRCPNRLYGFWTHTDEGISSSRGGDCGGGGGGYDSIDVVGKVCLCQYPHHLHPSVDVRMRIYIYTFCTPGV